VRGERRRAPRTLSHDAPAGAPTVFVRRSSRMSPRPLASLAVRTIGAVVLVAAPLAAQPDVVPERPYEIAYTVTVDDPASHLYEVTVDVGGIDADSVAFQFPVYSPGRYARMDFARLVQGVRVTDGSGSPLRWRKTGGSRWGVATGAGRPARVRFTYRYYANRLSGTFSVLDTAHANWNGPSLFPWVEGHQPDPVSLTVRAPEGWMLMNGHADSPAQRAFRFPNYDEFIDTPTEIAPRLIIDSVRVDGISYRLALHHNGAPGPGTVAKAMDDIEKIVRYQNTVMGTPPIARYTFLLNIGYDGRDGMEHLNSTQVINPGRWTRPEMLLAGMTTVSHEYFHVWNVKRIRPAALTPYDYRDAVHQPSLWVAEGWTNYYGSIGLVRAGVADEAWYRGRLANVIRVVSETPGRKERSARQASFDAPFFDGASPPMPMNRDAVFVSYYTRGESLALWLDLAIRAESGGTASLDDVLRLLKARTWEAPNASWYLQGRGYTEADVEQAVSDVMGRDMTAWFDAHVGGVEDLDWNAALAPVGLRVGIDTAGGGRRWFVSDLDTVTDAQRALRAGWLAGTTR
jgi:predicted metalloprotease with PDZ domain